MAPSSKSNNNPDELQEREKLQAVLLADSFLNTFRPLDLDASTPSKCLTPLNNVRLLDYALQFLAGNGVEELFVVCTSDEVEVALLRDHNNKNASVTGRMQVTCIKDTSLTNAGDALRELYKRNVVTSDFLLLFGDVVTNMDLTEAMLAHKQRHQQDSTAIMTLVLQPVGDASLSSPASHDLVVGMDPTQQNRVVLYHNLPRQNTVPLPCSFFAAHSQLEIRTDLMDTGIGICSPDVLGRFEDEFDYLDIAHDFVTNCVAEEEEGLQTRIHAHLLNPGEYAARVLDFATYTKVSQDLLRRWCYPIVADNFHLYKLGSKDYHYKEAEEQGETTIKVVRSSTVVGPGMMASHCHVAEHSTIRKSVLGRSCEIGNHVTIDNSHLWEGVQVHDGATITNAIVAMHCIIGKNAVVSKGCVLGEGVVIGENVVLPAFTRITLSSRKDDDPFGEEDDNFGHFGDDDDDDSKEKDSAKNEIIPKMVDETDHAIVGPDGKGHVWTPPPQDDIDDSDDDEDSEEDEDAAVHTNSNVVIQLQSMGADLEFYHQQRRERQAQADVDDWSEKNQNELEEERMQKEAFEKYTDDTFTFGDTATEAAAAFEPPTSMVVGRQKGVDVVQELMDICLEFEETSPMENLAIELNSYKFSQNASYSDCTMATTLVLLEKMQITMQMTDGKMIAALNQRLLFWAPLLQKMSMGLDEEKAIIYGLERAATSGDEGIRDKLNNGLSFRLLLQTLHNKEVLSEEALLAWKEERKEEKEDTPLGKLFLLPSVQDFLEWLEEESEEGESDDDDDDDEDSD